MKVKVADLPAKYDSSAEAKWEKHWEKTGIYRWDPKQPREKTFVVDTPPPTVSGSLHIGHVFSYTQTDVLVRYQRMLGKNIFYPIGWDDNGLPTERRVQNYYNLRCDPLLQYDKDWKPEHKPESKEAPKHVSRPNFVEACQKLTGEDEVAFEKLWRRIGLSFDWSLTYATIDKVSRQSAQKSFLGLIERGEIYNAVFPIMWDVDFKTAIAQAEIEDREIAGAFHDLSFAVEGGGEFQIATTRPELLSACIAVVAHPDDKRYQPLFGKRAITPLFHAPVPILPAEHADPEKGSGILMVCTFGDIMDVEFWKKSGLGLKQVIGEDGRFLPIKHGEGNFTSLAPEKADAAYAQLTGLHIKQAQKKMVELLSAEGSAVSGSGKALLADPKPIKHVVKFYEKGDRPLEFIPTRQWFQRILQHKEGLLEQGRKIEWHPSFMQTRYEHWVSGLNQDWCLSRQRFYGVPFPVWYPLDAQSQPDYTKPIFATTERLPVDPSIDVPPGYDAKQRNQPGGFCGDLDIMDTWATSCLTPQIAGQWALDGGRFSQVYPMDIRPQAHEIIRTWAFYTILRAWLHDGRIPWKHAVISGFIMDPDRKKMSKSKGNVVTPGALIEEHSADAARYWASRARLGVDTAYDDKLFGIGRKLVTKLFNAAKFVLGQFERIDLDIADVKVSDISEPLDLAVVERLRAVVKSASSSFEEFEYAIALQHSEEAFWSFCDHYLELVKVRSYAEEDSPQRRSAFATLGWSLKTFLRLFAPFLPYVTEEIWSWSFAAAGRERSIHTANWPALDEVSSVPALETPGTFEAAVEVISKIRGAKTLAQKSLKWPVTGLQIVSDEASIKALSPVLSDLLRAGNVAPEACSLKSGDKAQDGLFSVQVTLIAEWENPAKQG